MMSTVEKKVRFSIPEGVDCTIVNTGNKTLVGSTVINGKLHTTTLETWYMGSLKDEDIEDFIQFLINGPAPESDEDEE